jgi:cytochrome c biogenesis protein CcmG/thiol:disulfide interchange protein DsbE
VDEPVVPGERSLWRTGLKVGAIAAVLALIVLLAWATLVAGKGRSLVTRIAAGERPSAPAFELEVIWSRTDTWPAQLARALDDGTVSLDELRGIPVVLNFWASWCIPCREEAPVLAASARAHFGEVVLLGIDVQDLRGDALGFLREFDVPYVSLRDGDDDTFNAYGLTGVPETYFVDGEGRIVAHIPGAVTRETLETGIAKLMAASPETGSAR